MNFDAIWKIALAVVGAARGYGALVLLGIKFSANLIADRLEKKYELKLSKELEKYKSKLENKTYITKTRFDTEFKIYRELSKSFLTMNTCIKSMIKVEVVYKSFDEKTRMIKQSEEVNNVDNAIEDAQNCLYQNTPFIPEVFVTKYQDLLKMANKLYCDFVDKWTKNNLNINIKEFQKGVEIEIKLMDLNTDIRNYLSTLDVLD